MGTSIIWTPLYYGHLYNMDTSIIWAQYQKSSIKYYFCYLGDNWVITLRNALFLGLKDIVRQVREKQNPPASKNTSIKLNNGHTPSLDVSKVFRYYFPGEFSILITFRAMKLTNVYLVAMYDYRKIMTLGVRITPEFLSFEFERNSVFLNRRWSLDFPVKVRKELWNSVSISVQEREVTVYWNCKKTGTKGLQGKFSFIPDSLGEISLGKPLLVSSIESYEVSSVFIIVVNI